MTVSVVIPAYNAEPFVARAIDSVLNQTTPASEIIVVDDGSTDSTVAVVQSYGDKVRLITQANGGPSRARNMGVRASSGKYVAFLDADDWWDNDKTAQQLNSLRLNPGCVTSYTALRLRHDDGRSSQTTACSPEKLWPLLRICNPGIPPSCVMLARTAFDLAGGFNEKRKGCEDWELWFRLRQLGPFALVETPSTNYVVSNTGLSANADLMFADFQRMLDEVLLKDLKGYSRERWRRKALSYQSFKAALTARAALEKHKELTYMTRSLWLWPAPWWHPLRFKAMTSTLLRQWR